MQLRREDIQQVLGEVFEADPQDFALATGPEDVPTWDSFNHLNLVVSLEERCGVSFSTDEIASMLSVAKIVALLRERGVDVDWPE